MVEDDLKHVDIYKEKFSSVGFDFFSAISAREGLSLAKKKKPDIIVLDILLPPPEESGIFFLEEQKKDTKIAFIPVIAFSNLDDPPTKEKALALGAKEYLIKTDFTPNEVVLKTKEYLPNLSD